jgi:hypothetical protein
VEGDVRARAFIQYSDLRLKTDVASLVDALNVIEKLEPKSYKWLPNAPGLPALQDDAGTTHSPIGIRAPAITLNLNALAHLGRAGDDGTGGRRVIGLIAQEVQKVLPDVVYQDPVTGYLSVAYTVHTHDTQPRCFVARFWSHTEALIGGGHHAGVGACHH